MVKHIFKMLVTLINLIWSFEIIRNIFLKVVCILTLLLVYEFRLEFQLLSEILFIFEFKFEIIDLYKFVDLINKILRMIFVISIYILLAPILNLKLFLQLILSKSQIFSHNRVGDLSCSFNGLLARFIAGIENKALHVLFVW